MTLVWLLLVSVALGAPKTAVVEDPLVVASALVRDAAWSQARAVLDEVELGAKGVDQARYWTLIGLVDLNEDRPADAARAFEAALAIAVEGRELLSMHLARARLADQDPAGALAALDGVGSLADSMPGPWLLRAMAGEQLGRPDDAFAALGEGALRFPDQLEFPRQQVFLLVRLGLFREARERGTAMLSRADVEADDVVAISEALRRGGELGQARTLLEAALLSRGADRDLLVQAARVAIDDGQPRNAGRFLERAAVLDPALALEAAEAYRRGGDLDAALRVNGEALDPLGKARQRLGLLLEAQAWDRALALEDRLVRLGLVDDDGVAYGLAYAAFRLGDVVTAERWLSGIREVEVFRRATELREAMARCDPNWGCR